mgnify:CR=1 FL=1
MEETTCRLLWCCVVFCLAHTGVRRSELFMERTVIRDSGGPDRDSYPEISRPKQRSNLILQDAQLLHCCFILGISFASQDNRY